MSAHSEQANNIDYAFVFVQPLISNIVILGNSECMISKLIIKNNSKGTHCEIPQNLASDKSKLVQELAWYRQATIYYLSQC